MPKHMSITGIEPALHQGEECALNLPWSEDDDVDDNYKGDE